jgi:hypothetical protein
VQEFYPPEGFERNWMFLSEINHFREVVSGMAQSACTLQDGVVALRLSLAALQQQLVTFA